MAPRTVITKTNILLVMSPQASLLIVHNDACQNAARNDACQNAARRLVVVAFTFDSVDRADAMTHRAFFVCKHPHHLPTLFLPLP
jgi:hypothetical protein